MNVVKNNIRICTWIYTVHIYAWATRCAICGPQAANWIGLLYSFLAQGQIWMSSHKLVDAGTQAKRRELSLSSWFIFVTVHVGPWCWCSPGCVPVSWWRAGGFYHNKCVSSSTVPPLEDPARSSLGPHQKSTGTAKQIFGYIWCDVTYWSYMLRYSLNAKDD